MLTVTESAAEAITALTAQAQEGTEESGLRFALQSMENDGAQLALSVAPAPEDGDRVVGTGGGAKVFLEPQAAALLDDKVLDVQQDETGDVAFAVLPQQSV